MDANRIAQLLQPFAPLLSDAQLQFISIYIDVLLRWNARINLTAVREPEQIVTRHFGESLFTASRLFPAGDGGASVLAHPGTQVVDVGSGAGFPGLPIKIWAPQVHLILIESNQKKATFLHEIIRRLTLTNVDVFAGRAEDFPRASAEVVTLRAVERFEAALRTAADLVRAAGRVALLIGEGQVARAIEFVPGFAWDEPISVPQSSNRVLLIGKRTGEESQSIRT
ncbi:MAG: 16S rRNA (guanine(527)-N(7))-methyltransferase RsmG [Acidobacteriia bacterium]|nr:16S rRNA (guanine(527)-N(7))-methyltransferase RsmG [Terriglobia bacterium]